MRLLRQLEGLIEGWPLWAQLLVGVALLAFSLASIYGRFNPSFGAKVFSKIPEDQIQSNWAHIIGYTIIPVIVTIGYAFILYSKHMVE